MTLRDEVISLLETATKLKREELSTMVAVPPNPVLGDYAFPCFKLGRNAKEEAEKLKKKIKLPKSFIKMEVAGPYLNFFVNPYFIAEQTLTTVRKQKDKYGSAELKKNVVIEYCGPNTNKPLHLGHLRNMALGNAVGRILKFQGHDVHPVNIINDRGIHICQSMLAYKKWGKGKKPDKKGDHFVGDFYVLFAKQLKENVSLKDEAQQMLLQWEYNDKETQALWKKMTKWVLKGFAETYQRFGVEFEKEYFESEYYEKGKGVAYEGLQKDVFVKDDTKAIVAPLEKYGLSNKVILRGDGTSVYITQDLYLAQQRYADFKFDSMIYVVASEQQLHFKQLFKILHLLERPFACDLYHLSYGLVNLPTGRMKSREGTVVDADDLLDEVAALALQEVEKRYSSLSVKEKKRRAEFISLGAIKFFLLKVDASRDMIFNPEESISFDGETGPYVQYAHARACSILDKAGKQVRNSVDFFLLKESSEQALLKLLQQFPEKAAEAAVQYKPHILCHFVLDLAQKFNEFYHALLVISEDKKVMNARLMLVDAVRQVLANGLSLLGIYAPEEM